MFGKKGIGTTPLIVLAILGVIGILGATSMFMAAKRPAKPLRRYTGEIEGRWLSKYSDMGNISTTTVADDTLKMGNFTGAYQTRLAGSKIEVDGLISTLQFEYEEESGTLADNIDPKSFEVVASKPEGKVTTLSSVDISDNSIDAEISGDISNVDIITQAEQKSISDPGAVAEGDLGKMHVEAVKAGDNDELDLLLRAAFSG